MNESEFEQSLRKLPPATPSPNLAERIAAEMAAQGAMVVSQPRTIAPVPAPAAGVLAKPRDEAENRGGFGWLRSLGWAVAGAAAAIVVVSLRPSPPDENAAPSHSRGENSRAVALANQEPVESTDELIATSDEGLIYDDGSPQRQLRMTYLERYTWTNPKTGAVIEMEVPREDVVLMPVAMQ